MSISPASSILFRPVGTPVTSSTSCVSGGRPAPCSRTRSARAWITPPEERHQVAVEVEGRELARPEVRVPTPSRDTGWSTSFASSRHSTAKPPS